MGFQDYVSETEAATIAGVSVATLNRFAETGYLQVEVEGDGLRLFSKAELATVFGVDVPGEASAVSLSTTPMNRPTADRPTDAADEETGASDAPQSLAQQVEVIQSPAREASPPVSTGTETETTDTPRQASSSVSAAATTELLEEYKVRIASLEKEAQRFRTLADMQERLLDMRENELKERTKERDWLRTRIEHLEEKQDRDQLLLLAETQTIRKLVSLEESRRSPFRAFLEWLGVVPEKGTQPVRALPRHQNGDVTSADAN